MLLSPRQKQWAWFAGLWLGGLGAVSLLAYGIRAFMGALGLL